MSTYEYSLKKNLLNDMELLNPQNFFQLAELFTNILTGAVAIAGLFIALLTYRVAVSALEVWKNEKQFEIEIEIKSKMGEAITILNKLNKVSFLRFELDENQIWVIDDLQKRFNDDDLIKVQLLQSGFHNHFFKNVESDLIKLRQVSMKAISYNENYDIKEFYKLWSLYEGEIYNTIYNYTVVKLEYYSKKYNFPYLSTGELLPLPKLIELINKGISLEDGIEELFNNLKSITKEPDYIKMLNIYSVTYFPRTEMMFQSKRK